MEVRSSIIAVLVAAALLPAAKLRAQLGQAPLSAEKVRTSIRQGVDYLLNEQSGRGTWDDMTDYPGGVTALATLALLEAGVEPSHPKIQKSLGFLRALKPTKTYTVSLQTMALCAAEPKRDRLIIQQNADWLARHQIIRGQRAGSWSYPLANGIGGDNSNSQFAVLALHEAERVGATVNPAVWRLAADYWQNCQNPDGSWGYQPVPMPGSGSMTCAGIGAWVICSGHIGKPAARADANGIECCLPPEKDDVLDRALAWMARNFSVRGNIGQGGGGAQWHYYYLYGLERVGRLSARRFIGDHDWYREGAEFLISQQDPFSHHWLGQLHSEDNPHIATSLALLFLSKGRRPVLLAKAKYGPDDDWNNHPSDVANLTAFTEQQWGLNLTWQIIEPAAATVEDLLQTPVLYISGSKAPQLDGQEQKIRDYIDRGGFLFAEACCASSGQFQQGIRQFLDRVFPEGEYKLRLAEPSHPIWRIDKLVRPDSPYVGRLWVIEYGCRTCVVFSEVDLSCYWELYGRGRVESYPEVVRQRLEDANAIGLNVLAYATNREPKGKEESFPALDAPDLADQGARGVIRVAKLMHGGGCNDAPGALANLLRAASQGEMLLQVSGEQVDLRASDPGLLRFHLAFMHGRQDFHFTPEEQAGLRKFLENGGTLLADAICASKEFAEAFRREIALVLPERKLQRIPLEHPLFSEAGEKFNIQQVHLREPAASGGEANQPLRSKVQTTAPELEGVEIDGRMAVIFSPYDISCALEQHEALQCRGYTREDAARIALNVLKYSLAPDVGATRSASQ
ncbi:MAG: prenyltransferase [Planctomycetota bacterium]|nr:MAG: prenyltransferase [Planctomycetota bacterium]